MATGFQHSSQTVRDLIQKSKLISKGPPAIYHLLTSRSNLEKDGSVRKWTFGQRDNNMQNKIILMVGETGTGKTSLINAMVNYIFKVKFTDEVWFEITEEGGDKQLSDQSKTQTTEITMYEVFAQDNPICLTIIDTPGYGDTRGTEYDQQIDENLHKLFLSDTGVKEIDVVCLVVKASENRLSDRQQYIFDAILSLFGKDLENNIVIFVTHSDGMPPDDALNAIKNAGIPCRNDEESEPEHFLFNNTQAKKRNQRTKPNYQSNLKKHWELTQDNFDTFFAFLKEENRKSLEQTSEVLSESKQLKGCITNLQSRIELVESKGKELAQIQEALEKNQEKIQQNENFTFTVTKSYKEKVPIENPSFWNRKVTSCSFCEENCHEYDCWLAPKALWCEVIKNNHCTSCTNKCHHNKHVRENMKYVTKKKDTTMTYNDLKIQYESSNDSATDIKFDSKEFDEVKMNLESCKNQEQEKKNIEKRLKEDKATNETKKAGLVEEAYNSIMKLLEIALKPDSAFIVDHINFIIPRVEETGREDYAQKLRVIQPESQERVNAIKAYAKPDRKKNFKRKI